MVAWQSDLTANEVLRAFHHDEPYLFLGAAFTTVALVTGAFGILRRRFDLLLFYFALFSLLYGQRLWMQSDLLALTLFHNHLFFLFRNAVNYVVPIPGLLYFQASGLLGKFGKPVVIVLTVGFLSLFAATFIFGIHNEFFVINSVLAIAPFLLLLRNLFSRTLSKEFSAIRPGLIVFTLCLVWDNIFGASRNPPKIEPYGFAVFLASLGYVAARRTMERDKELNTLQQELQLAKRIQLSILPSSFPASEYFRVAARYVPMTSVAGDFYDFLPVVPTEAGLLIADVSGHGVPAALIASMVKMAAASQRENATQPAQILTGMNTALCGNTQSQFVSAAYVYIDAEMRELRYSAAGHPAMLLLRRGEITQITENGLILAIFESARYTQLSMRIEPGDRLVLYTDGILEASNSNGEFFGEEKLHGVIKKTAAMTPADAADQLILSVEEWHKSQEDDLTVIVCDFIAEALLLE